jgi:hypothetical protein
MINIISDLIKTGSRKTINHIEKILTEIFIESLRAKKLEFEILTFNNKVQVLIKDGFNSYTGNTIVEIKLYQHPSGMYKFTEKELEDDGTNRIATLINARSDIRNIIYVVNSEAFIESNTLTSRVNSIKEKYKRYIIDFMPLNIITNYTKEVSEKLGTILSNFQEDIFKNEIKEAVFSKDDWRVKRDVLISEVKRKYIDDDLVLFLGAGVSIDAGIPIWNELITDMFVNYLEIPLVDSKISFSDNEKAKIVDYFLASNDGAPTLQAMYVKTMGKKSINDSNISTEEVFRELLHKVLYKQCNGQSALLNEIVEFCRATRHGKGLHAIVTYNFDDLVEQNFKRNRMKYRSIYRDFDLPKKSEMPIYHVHGFLPQDTELIGNMNNGHLVFTQDEYHKLYYDHYHWANLVQLNFLKEKSCIFVGLSMTDPNLRRMLDLAKPIDEDNNTERKHYAILQRDKLKIKKKQGLKKEHLEAFEVSNQRVKELYFEDLGVNVIWFDNYEEIPSILKRISDN